MKKFLQFGEKFGLKEKSYLNLCMNNRKKKRNAYRKNVKRRVGELKKAGRRRERRKTQKRGRRKRNKAERTRIEEIRNGSGSRETEGSC